MIWERVKSVFQAALERPPGERVQFLNMSCGSDTELKSEVESLIRSYENSGEFIEEPAFQVAAELIVSGKAEKTVETFRPKPAAGVEKGLVLAWLVCVQGPDRGRDYAVRGEHCYIGRAPEMDVRIAGDSKVSRTNHGSVSYNPRNNTFKLRPGTSTELLYLNDDEVSEPSPLQPYDRIALGDTELLFLPLCGDKFKW